MSYTSRNADKFIRFVRSECRDYNIDFYINKYRYVSVDGFKSAGYFSDDKFDGYEGRLAVASKRRFNIWFPVLVHEYAHMTQWIDGYEYWYDDSISNGDNAYESMFSWFEHKKEYTESQLDEIFAMVIEIERDCDRRAVNIIKKYNLPIDVKSYIKKSNLYHYSYHIARDRRLWFNIPSMYRSRKLLSLMPDHWKCKSRYVISKDKYDAIDRYVELKGPIEKEVL